MYIIALDPWGSYVDGRSIKESDLVKAFAKSKGFTTEETHKEPVVDLLHSPIKAYEESLNKPVISEVKRKKK